MSREFDADPTDPVIEFMTEQRTITDKGGTMRLGAYPCDLAEGTLARRVYGSAEVQERHRHRLEVNPDYHDRLTDAGMIFSGMSPDRVLVEVVELPNHPWFLGCQFHPEVSGAFGTRLLARWAAVVREEVAACCSPA